MSTVASENFTCGNPRESDQPMVETVVPWKMEENGNTVCPNVVSSKKVAGLPCFGVSCYEKKIDNSFGIDFLLIGLAGGMCFFLFPLDHEIHVFKNSRHPTTQVAKDYFHPTRKSKSSNKHLETTKRRCAHLKKESEILPVKCQELEIKIHMGVSRK